MQVPIGVSDFRSIIETRDSAGRPYLFVDKSLLIKEIIENLTPVKLITRPRRFGKTLNMSMLHHFFARTVNNKPTEHLFKGLKIAEYNQFMKHQGQYPVIFLSFKDINSNSYESAYEDFCKLLSQAYEQHEEVVLSCSTLTERQKNQYKQILNRDAPESDIKAALKDLTVYIEQGYGVKPIVLIDEYDTPIQTAYVKKYYEDMVTLMREFLGPGLKDNAHLKSAVLTGILRVSKESIFSGLNNIKTYSVLHGLYGEYYGFTEEEVSQLLTQTNLESQMNEVKDWYNGYQIGNHLIYNPWSIVNYIQEHGKLSAYWVNTSDNVLIKDLFVRSSSSFKSQFEYLLNDKPIAMLIDEHIVFNNFETHESVIWTLMLMAGYLKATFIENVDNDPLYQLQIPNREVKNLYRNLIAEWLSGVHNAMVFNQFLNNLLSGDTDNFEDDLQKIMLQTFSMHDVKGKNSEKFYHGFLLGLISGIDKNHYTIHSNKESGLGRYDITIIPSNINKLGIIMEIKNVDEENLKSLKTVSNEAIQQIDAKQYDTMLLQHNIQSCLKIGIAFKGKELAMSYKLNT